MENQFRQYPLEEAVFEALEALGYEHPTEIQAAVIPAALQGRDIIAKSKTGSGKTAAFAIPICSSIDWEENLALALKLHVELERTAPGICRYVNLRAQRFNQDESPGALLVEVGAAGNTHAEAITAVEVLAQSILSLAHGAEIE